MGLASHFGRGTYHSSYHSCFLLLEKRHAANSWPYSEASGAPRGPKHPCASTQAVDQHARKKNRRSTVDGVDPTPSSLLPSYPLSHVSKLFFQTHENTENTKIRKTRQESSFLSSRGPPQPFYIRRTWYDRTANHSRQGELTRQP